MYEERERLISEWVEKDNNILARCLENSDFRAFLCRLIAATGMFDTSVYENDREHWIAEGRRMFGLHVLEAVEAAKYGAAPEIIKEMFKNKQVKENQIRKVESYGGTD